MQTWIENKGFAKTNIMHNGHHDENEMKWNLDYNGKNAHVNIDINDNHKHNKLRMELDNNDIMNLLGMRTVPVPLEKRLAEDFLSRDSEFNDLPLFQGKTFLPEMESEFENELESGSPQIIQIEMKEPQLQKEPEEIEEKKIQIQEEPKMQVLQIELSPPKKKKVTIKPVVLKKTTQKRINYNTPKPKTMRIHFKSDTARGNTKRKQRKSETSTKRRKPPKNTKKAKKTKKMNPLRRFLRKLI